jgi:hypothetical protein
MPRAVVSEQARSALSGTCLEDLGVQGVGGVVQHAAGAADRLRGVVAGAGGAVLVNVQENHQSRGGTIRGANGNRVTGVSSSHSHQHSHSSNKTGWIESLTGGLGLSQPPTLQCHTCIHR